MLHCNELQYQNKKTVIDKTPNTIEYKKKILDLCKIIKANKGYIGKIIRK